MGGQKKIGGAKTKIGGAKKNRGGKNENRGGIASPAPSLLLSGVEMLLSYPAKIFLSRQVEREYIAVQSSI